MSFEYVDDFDLFGMLGNSFKYLVSLVRMIYYSLYWLITGTVGLSAMTGPVGITTIVGEVITADVAVSSQNFNVIEYDRSDQRQPGRVQFDSLPGFGRRPVGSGGSRGAAPRKEASPRKTGADFPDRHCGNDCGWESWSMGNDIWRIIQG